MAERFPLTWPPHWRRTRPELRRPASFRTKKGDNRYGYDSVTIAEGIARLKVQLGLLSARSILISSNVPLNSFGEPTSRGAESRVAGDPGVAVYFELEAHDRVLACDKWMRVADNFAAVAAHIECIRGIDRYGVGTIEQAFAGYDALPAPSASNRPSWRKIFGIPEDMPATRNAIEVTYRELAKRLHPDSPSGSHDAMAQLNEARAMALAEIGA